MAIPDFPFQDPEGPSFAHHSVIREYLMAYAKHFNLHPYVKVSFYLPILFSFFSFLFRIVFRFSVKYLSEAGGARNYEEWSNIMDSHVRIIGD